MLQAITRRQSALRASFLILVLTLVSCALFAQRFTGRVTDPSGAVVPKADVTVHNQKTNVDINTKTTDSGVYTVPYLNPGLYTVSAEAAGFRKALKTDITLEVGQTAVIDLPLQVGSANDSVTVRADAELLDYGKADSGEVIENTRVTEMPLNGRNPFMLSTLQAGAIWDGKEQYKRPFDNAVGQNLNINGGGKGENSILMDGISDSSGQMLAYVAPADAVQEFKVVTTPYDAQYGRLRGGAVEMVLKSGTNKLHGSVYEFARRGWLDANSWQNDYYLATQPTNTKYLKAKHKLNQYGAQLDGPVVLPKVYNGRDKSFFVLQYENWDEIMPSNSIVTSVPDPKWLTGDFSGLQVWNGSSFSAVTIYDPLTTDPKTGIRTPFPGNKIPAARLDATALKLLSFYPAPNITLPASATQWQSNYLVPNPTTDRYRNLLGKLDHLISPKDRVSLRYGWWERYEYNSVNGMPGVTINGETPLGTRSHTLGAQWTHTASSNLLFDVRIAGIVNQALGFQTVSGFNLASLWPSSMVSQFPGFNANYFPRLDINNFANFGSINNTYNATYSLNLMPTMMWMKGAHTFHAGVDLRFLQYTQMLPTGGPQLTFSPAWTQQYYDHATQNTGNTIASMLLGTAASGSATINPRTFWSQHYYAPFIQDDWRILPRLTLNLGLRWDFNMPPVERHNEGLYAFDSTTVNPADSQVNHLLLTNKGPIMGGFGYLGVNGAPRTLYTPAWINIQPRVGFAYAVNKKTVVRGGIGEFFMNALTASSNTLGFSATTQYLGSLDGGRTSITNLSNPYPTINQPTGSSLGMLAGLGMSVGYTNPHFSIPNVWMFSLGVERQLTKDTSLEVSYVGNRSYNDTTTNDVDHWDPAFVSQCDPTKGGNYNLCNAQVPNPFKGAAAFQGTNYYSVTTVKATDLSRPYPQFTGISEGLINDASSWYNSLQVTATHKANNLTLHGTWTYSKSMNTGGFQDATYSIPNRGLSGDDMTHRVTISGVYTLPFGRGRAMLSNANRLVDGVLGGWELGGLSSYETGRPWGAPSGYYMVGDPRVKRSILANGDERVISPCVWTVTNPVTGATAPIQAALDYGCTQPVFIQKQTYAPAQNVVYSGIRQLSGLWLDTNFAKNFTITEAIKLQLRFEGFNILNHPLFQNGFYTNTDSRWGTIGRVSGGGQSNLPRQTQVAVRITW